MDIKMEFDDLLIASLALPIAAFLALADESVGGGTSNFVANSSKNFAIVSFCVGAFFASIQAKLY